MASTSADTQASGRRYRGHSCSPPRADPLRRRPRSCSPPQRYGSPPERVERWARDSNCPLRHSRPEVFQSGAAPHGRVCMVCLGHHEHIFARCEEAKLWDGSANAPQKGKQGQLVTVNGLLLCFNWQILRGCSSLSHPDQHRCSGCGRSNHGAQGCP